MKILVTGGTGYIGSHTCVVLLEAGYRVVIADNLSNSRVEVLDEIEKITGQRPAFYQIDVTDAVAVDAMVATERPIGVIHFAGFKAVGESVTQPLAYYRNNLMSLMVIAEACLKHQISALVFSSSATVYGESEPPLIETLALQPTTNPYGETKAMCERILIDTAYAFPNLKVSLLRYFNPVGAHESGLIGEVPSGIPNNLMPYITQVAHGKLDRLKVFGNDYPTVDGTGVRDFIHVMDLAQGHLLALRHLQQATVGIEIYNLGTGAGTSVLQLISAFERATGVSVPYDIAPQRAGDLSSVYADVTKAKKELGFSPTRDIDAICRDAWRFQKQRSV